MSFSTTILGYPFAAPFFIAPAANAGLNNPQDAEAAIVRAAGNASILYVVCAAGRICEVL
jgi:isopentenyl diphosphate isomerase/L-lactate dehydrogenase-like FMN-dependent dehydrogenase